MLPASLGVGCGQDDAAPPAFCEQMTAALPLVNGTSREEYLGLSIQETAVGRLIPADAESVTSAATGCTGTVIAPGWVLTAAHCNLPTQGPLRFVVSNASGEETAAWPSRRILPHGTFDLMLVELEADPAEMTAAAGYIPVADENDAVNPGDRMVMVGFGTTENGTRGDRRFLVERLVAQDDEMLVVDGHSRTGACTGDSGGPLLFRAEDGTIRVAGVLSDGDASCVGKDRYVSVWAAFDFLSSEVPIPCLPPQCGGIGSEGRCFEQTAVWCAGARIRGEGCAGGRVCGWSAAVNGFRCVNKDTSACADLDEFGRCDGDIALRCSRGTVDKEDCVSTGTTCTYDANGRAACM